MKHKCNILYLEIMLPCVMSIRAQLALVFILFYWWGFQPRQRFMLNCLPSSKEDTGMHPSKSGVLRRMAFWGAQICMAAFPNQNFLVFWWHFLVLKFPQKIECSRENLNKYLKKNLNPNFPGIFFFLPSERTAVKCPQHCAKAFVLCWLRQVSHLTGCQRPKLA